MRRLGIVLILAGLGIIPVSVIIVALWGSGLDKQDAVMSLFGGIVLSGEGVTGGIALLWLDSRLNRRPGE